MRCLLLGDLSLPAPYLILFVHHLVIIGYIRSPAAFENKRSASLISCIYRDKSSGAVSELFGKNLHILFFPADNGRTSKRVPIIILYKLLLLYQNVSGIIYWRQQFRHSSIKDVLIVNRCVVQRYTNISGVYGRKHLCP